MSTEFRIESDSMGELSVPADALWGPQTQRAVQNFPISGQTMPRDFIRALGLVKEAAAIANLELGLLDEARATAIINAARTVSSGRVDGHFPVDVFQTGSGTSSNMNANEVIARMASLDHDFVIHPNDHVNMGQSSNDVIPTVIQVSAALAAYEKLIPSLQHLAETLDIKGEELAGIVKTGRTHLMDAMPVTFTQELGCWSKQIRSNIKRIRGALKRVRQLPLGGSAVGTGINAHPEFGPRVAAVLQKLTGCKFRASANYFEGISSQDVSVELSGQLKTLACSLMKIANDLRLMNSGPLAGIGEIELPALQPGSSIMPGKVNPVIPEAVCMVAAQVIGNDATITVAGQSGAFQLNVMLPVVAENLLRSLGILSSACDVLADKAIVGFKVREDNTRKALERNPILVTALNPVIGYELGAEIAKKAYRKGRPIKQVAREMTDLSAADLDRLLDPLELTKGGIKT
ncbi:MAG: class II fumarate hydratase [Xanthomonadales bacterium]|jgi:fumarate hydratase class II|nr:class II fumarate hydratase [Xanthomonadales bacterium]